MEEGNNGDVAVGSHLDAADIAMQNINDYALDGKLDSQIQTK